MRYIPTHTCNLNELRKSANQTKGRRFHLRMQSSCSATHPCGFIDVATWRHADRCTARAHCVQVLPLGENPASSADASPSTAALPAKTSTAIDTAPSLENSLRISQLCEKNEENLAVIPLGNCAEKPRFSKKAFRAMGSIFLGKSSRNPACFHRLAPGLRRSCALYAKK